MVLSRKDFIISEKKQEKKTGDCGAEDGDSTEEPWNGGGKGRVTAPGNRWSGAGQDG